MRRSGELQYGCLREGGHACKMFQGPMRAQSAPAAKARTGRKSLSIASRSAALGPAREKEFAQVKELFNKGLSHTHNGEQIKRVHRGDAPGRGFSPEAKLRENVETSSKGTFVILFSQHSPNPPTQPTNMPQRCVRRSTRRHGSRQHNNRAVSRALPRLRGGAQSEDLVFRRHRSRVCYDLSSGVAGVGSLEMPKSRP